MPLFYLRRLTGKQRTEKANRHLAYYLAFIAGATNAGGFLAVRQYTSHMSGIVSAMAENLTGEKWALFFRGFSAVAAFLLGAFLTSILVRWARGHELDSEYALPLIVEAFMMVAFACTGRVWTADRLLSTTLLLCFTMGLQNAIITKVSNAVIRTTHLTGMLTDIGIILGALVMGASRSDSPAAAAERSRLHLLAALVSLFFLGGVTGGLGFKHAGFLFTLPLALILLVLAAMPVWDDLKRPAVSS